MTGAKLDLAEIKIELKHGDRSDPSRIRDKTAKVGSVRNREFGDKKSQRDRRGDPTALTVIETGWWSG